MKKGKGKYWKTEVQCSNGVNDMIFTVKYAGGTQKGSKREKKSKPTSEQKKAHNLKKTIEKLFYLLLCNFFPGDYHLVFTYPKGLVQSPQEAKAIFSNFLALYREYCKKHGWNHGYVYNTEIGAKGALHHHCIMHSHKNIEDLEELWFKVSGGKIQHRSNLWANYDWYGLAEYFVDKTKGGKLPDTHIQGERHYVPSKGLRRPIIRMERIEAERWYKPKAKKGYELIKDSIRDGEDELKGGNFIKFAMRRLI